MQHVSAAVTDADVLLVVTDIFQERLLESAADHEGFLRKLVETERPIIVAINKIDLIDDASTTIEEVTQRWTAMLPGAEVVLISALEVPPPTHTPRALPPARAYRPVQRSNHSDAAPDAAFPAATPRRIRPGEAQGASP